MNSASRDRNSGHRLVKANGVKRTFTLWALTKDRLKGEQSYAPTATTIDAYCLFTLIKESKDRGVVAGDQTLLVETLPFHVASLELTDEWRLTMGDGVVRKVSGPVKQSHGLYSSKFGAGGSSDAGV